MEPHTSKEYRRDRFQKAFVLLLVVAITYISFVMIRNLVTAIMLAAIFSGLTYSFYNRLVGYFKGRKGLASTVTLLATILVIVVPLSAFVGIVATEAVQMTRSVSPWIEEQISEPTELDAILESLPFAEEIAPYKTQILSKLGELAGRTGTFMVNSVASATSGTATFFFELFVMLYAMFFFLIYGRETMERLLYYMPLSYDDKIRMVSKFVSVSRATLKGTLVIAIVQGGLGGAAFAIVGIPAAVFWGTVMAVLSIIPLLGTGLVWVPAVIYLIIIGKVGAAIGTTIWFIVVVGTADNILRPILVGKDTKMPDLLILLGTLGGLTMFGALGVIIGPIVAALFLTIWDIYGTTFSDYLSFAPADEATEREAIHEQDPSFAHDENEDLIPPTGEVTQH